jgi:hypothetical protein
LRIVRKPAANLLPIKVDVHKIFDAWGFAIVPKIAKAETFHYILSSHHAEFWPTHHDILVHNLRERSRPYLFARFAWAILLQVKNFIIAGQRRVVQLHAATDGEGFETAEYKTEVLSQSGGAAIRWNFLVFIFSILFLIIAPAGHQCRQPVPSSTRSVAILWRFPGMPAQILCPSRGINIGRFPGILERS